MALLRILCWALLFLTRLLLPSGMKVQQKIFPFIGFAAPFVPQLGKLNRSLCIVQGLVGCCPVNDKSIKTEKSQNQKIPFTSLRALDISHEGGQTSL